MKLLIDDYRKMSKCYATKKIRWMPKKCWLTAHRPYFYCLELWHRDSSKKFERTLVHVAIALWYQISNQNQYVSTFIRISLNVEIYCQKMHSSSLSLENCWNSFQFIFLCIVSIHSSVCTFSVLCVLFLWSRWMYTSVCTTVHVNVLKMNLIQNQHSLSSCFPLFLSFYLLHVR